MNQDRQAPFAGPPPIRTSGQVRSFLLDPAEQAWLRGGRHDRREVIGIGKRLLLSAAETVGQGNSFDIGALAKGDAA